MALIYIAIGHYFKDYFINNKILIGISIIGTLTMIILVYFNVINIIFSMKEGRLHYNPILQVLFPCLMTISLLYVMKTLSKISILSSVLSNIGKRSLTIMYLHLPIYCSLLKLGITNLIVLPIVAVILTYGIFYFILEKNKYLSYLFLAKK